MRRAIVWTCLLLVPLSALAQTPAPPQPPELKVLPDTLNGAPPAEMMRQYLLQAVNQAWDQWRQAYEFRETPEAIALHNQTLQSRFTAALGRFPERTPLNPQITGIIAREGYTVEKIIFESQPKFFVTALYFRPDPAKFAPPYPGVIVPCGHAGNAKAHDEYESMGASLAYHGMAALVFDPIEQGERCQLLDNAGNPVIQGTFAHTMAGIGSILMGRNTARYEVWDGMRAIDYLQSREEVDPERIGCTGNSGGGTQTSYLMSLDYRIKAAAPSCYVQRLGRQLRSSPGDGEQNIFGQLAFGMDQPDYLTMQAPLPILICAATNDFFEIDGTWEAYRAAKRLYTRLGYPERISLLENDEGHNYNVDQRTGVLRWMSRWLLHKDEPLTEPAIQLLSDQEVLCTPKGQVMLLDGARSVYDLNRDFADQLAARRQALWRETPSDELLNRVRKLIGIQMPKGNIPTPQVENAGKSTYNGKTVEKFVIIPEPGIYLPALRWLPASGNPAKAVLYIDGDGKAASGTSNGIVESSLARGLAVIAVDLRGLGETQASSQTKFGPNIGLDWEDYYKAYVLGQSYVGMRTGDVLSAAQLARAQYPEGVELVAVGTAGIPGLHAAALEPSAFSQVTLIRTLQSWDSILRTPQSNNQLINAVHGALEVYDLPDLRACLGNACTIQDPVDPLGNPIKP